ncbi:MAG: NADH-quinone oxidoreductase subunit L [Cytophagales bacterium]|nr:NADH-quinone oxidoreductase subunit L [Cytophagales bacterium]
MLSINELTKALQPVDLSVWAGAMCLMPLLSFLIISVSIKRLNRGASIIANHLMAIATIISIYLFSEVWGGEAVHARWEWFSVDSTSFTFGLVLDSESVLLLFVVSVVSWLVHLFSVNYMQEDRHYARYFSYLGLFTFAMFGLVLSDNLLLLFVFWEIVGFASYLLIGFWFQRQDASLAAKKAFLTNRVGDVGFLLGLGILFSMFGTLDLSALKALMQSSSVEDGQWVVSFLNHGAESVHRMPELWLTVAGLGLFCGTVGKSAQFPLQVWLPGAMKGPTPVSALIHAATMVAAGVYLLARVFPLLTAPVLTVIACVGALTAISSALAALAQYDIKKVLAYSTSSQLGYMVMGMGVGAYDAAFFHLITHAFFKAGLFLSAGAIIRRMHVLEYKMQRQDPSVIFDVNDMRLMGGLRKRIPFVFSTYLITSAALMGIPFFSGFLSKDAILNSAWAWASLHEASLGIGVWLVPFVGFVTVFLTAAYMVRQITLIFFGDFRLGKYFPEFDSLINQLSSPHWKKKVPLFILAFMSIGFVFSVNPFLASSSWLYSQFEIPASLVPVSVPLWHTDSLTVEMLEESAHLPAMLCSLLLVGAGLFAGIRRYRAKQKAGTVDMPSEGLVYSLSFRNFYLERAIQLLVIAPALKFAGFAAWFDAKAVDRLNDLAAGGVLLFSKALRFGDRALDKAVNSFAVLQVIVAKLVALFDYWGVDSFVRSVGSFALAVGKCGKRIQGRTVQRSVLLAVLALLVMIFFFFGI